MTTDLFKNDKELLKDFILSRKRVRTSEVIAFGSKIHSNRAERNARDLAKAGIIGRLKEDLKIRYYGSKVREDIWTVFPEEMEK